MLQAVGGWGGFLLQMSPVINQRLRNIRLLCRLLQRFAPQLLSNVTLKRERGGVDLQRRGKVVVGEGHQLLQLRLLRATMWGDLRALTFVTPRNMLPPDM